MKSSLLLFLAAFVLGSAGAITVRAVRHSPKATPPAQPPAVASASVAPTRDTPSPQHSEATPTGHAGVDAATKQTVNTICTICGMDVDPSVPPAEYQGMRIGFGCKACPPKFAADPGKYGPHALKNEVTP